MLACWVSDDGVLKLRSDDAKTGSILWTEKDYTDFEMEFDFRFGDGTVDSGIFIRDKAEQIQIGPALCQANPGKGCFSILALVSQKFSFLSSFRLIPIRPFCCLFNVALHEP